MSTEARKHAVITVRLPPDVRDKLKELAWSMKMSLNQLCVNCLTVDAKRLPALETERTGAPA